MTADLLLVEMYFDWLREEAFTAKVNRKTYEGVLRCLNDIPFYWTIWSDENRAGDALSFRQHEFINTQNDLDGVDQHWLYNWAVSAPSVLEVLLGCARRYVSYFGGEVPYYFGHMFRNMELDRFPGRVLDGTHQETVRAKVDVWLSHQFEPNGHGSPFFCPRYRQFGIGDLRQADIWQQMNAYSLEHFQ